MSYAKILIINAVDYKNYKNFFKKNQDKVQFKVVL